MKKFIFFLMLIAAFSFSNESKACIVLPNNNVTIAGPTAPCATDPTGSYSINYSTGADDPYQLYFAVVGGTISNIQTYTSLGGVIGGAGCVPTQTSSFSGVCFTEEFYFVPPACRGGISFDVDWGDDCISGDKFILADLVWIGAGIQRNTAININPNCLDNPEDEDVYISSNLGDGNSMDLKIYPNPAIGSSTIISLPADFEDYEVRIIDMNGRLVNQFLGASGKLALNTTDMHGGVYFVQAIANDGTINTQKLLISK